MDMAERDSDRILDELGGLIRQLARITGTHDDDLSLTGTQRLALFELGTNGPLRLVRLAELLGVTAPTASRAVDALEAKRLVERHPDPEDRRAQRIALTADGRTRFDERQALVRSTFEPAVRGLSPEERARLRELLARVRADLSDRP
jgi:DNA-binding MarR family transcriptional regulator